MSDQEIADNKGRFNADWDAIGCGFILRVKLFGGAVDIGLRFSPRNAWVGVRYTSFRIIRKLHFVMIGLLPCVQLQIGWNLRPASGRL